MDLKLLQQWSKAAHMRSWHEFPQVRCETQKYLEMTNSCITPEEQYKVPASPSHDVQKICNFCPQPHSSIYTHTMDPSTQPEQEVSSDPADTKLKTSWHDVLRALD